jgi:hypothetical protein
MNPEKFGIFVADILNEKELHDSQKETVILHALDDIDFIKTISKRSLTTMLEELYELDYGNFGKVSAYVFLQKELLNSVLEKNLELKDQLFSYEQENRPTKRARPARSILNEPNSFHDGRPCVKCNSLADYFNKKGTKISLPGQHPYGRCPLYCNICPGNLRCEEPELHLSYSCKNCSKDYCNHPTSRCIKK